MGVMISITLAVLGILGAALSRQLSDEFKAWTPWLIDYLIRQAVQKLPFDQRERFNEEWRSHLAEIPGQIGQVFVAIGCVRAAESISRTAPTKERSNWKHTTLKYCKGVLGFLPVMGQLTIFLVKAMAVSRTISPWVVNARCLNDPDFYEWWTAEFERISSGDYAVVFRAYYKGIDKLTNSAMKLFHRK